MKLQDGRGVEAPHWNLNEIVANEDINFISLETYQNFTNLLVMIANNLGFSFDVSIDGLFLDWVSGMTCSLRSGSAISRSGAYLNGGVWGFVANAGNIFLAVLGQDTQVVFDVGAGGDRYDTVQIRPVLTPYDSRARSYKDPITGFITSALTFVKVDFGCEIAILKGTPGAGVAPSKTVGWIKIAEVLVHTADTVIDQSHIKDVRSSTTWTTEEGTTKMRITLFSSSLLDDLSSSEARATLGLDVLLAQATYPIGARIESFIKLTPGPTCPVVRVDDADHDIDTTHYSALVTALRAIKLEVNSTTDHPCTVAASVITLSATTAGDRLLAMLAEDQLADTQFGKTGYSIWLSANINGTDYVITNVNPGARTITVTGSPATGAQTLIIYRYRIAGSATSARLLRDSGKAFVGTHAETTDTVADRWLMAGLRVRDRGQGHWHNYYYTLVQNGTTSTWVDRLTVASSQGPVSDRVKEPISDGTNGTPRVGNTTDPRATVGYIYMGAGI
jgi:hypothetical protein